MTRGRRVCVADALSPIIKQLAFKYLCSNSFHSGSQHRMSLAPPVCRTFSSENLLARCPTISSIHYRQL
jgi:hypothetical protein